MEMPSLTIGGVTSRLPIIQGGMAVRISMAPLAAAVAEAGGIGVIAGSGLTPDELRAEIRAARAETDGVIGVNIMVAVRNFAELVKAAIDEGIDLVISGRRASRATSSTGRARPASRWSRSSARRASPCSPRSSVRQRSSSKARTPGVTSAPTCPSASCSRASSRPSRSP